MRPNISEFSYGFCVTDELIHHDGTAVTAAPVFPSLYEEGQTGGGYDLMLDRAGVPLFLQFKLCHCMVRRNASECEEGYLSVPYYRMHVRPPRHSDQHQMLLDLENAGHEVYYCAPAFHDAPELDDAWLSHTVRNRSVWIPPSWIGPLPDDEEHYVAFEDPDDPFYYFCSEPRQLEGKANYEIFAHKLQNKIRQSGRRAIEKEQLFNLAHQMSDIADRRRDISDRRREIVRSELVQRGPIEQIAFYSHVFFECQFYIAHEHEES